MCSELILIRQKALKQRPVHLLGFFPVSEQSDQITAAAEDMRRGARRVQDIVSGSRAEEDVGVFKGNQINAHSPICWL